MSLVSVSASSTPLVNDVITEKGLRMEIRRAIQSDSEGIHRLIYLTSLQCCFSEAEPCPEWFVASIGPEKIEAFIEDEQYCWLVASKENEVVGVLAIIEGKLIKYFFVHPNFHRNGVARSLWKLAAPVLEPEVTVRSSVFAIRFYESLGFKKIGGVENFKGLQYQAMVANF